jgi:hypothetical protein
MTNVPDRVDPHALRASDADRERVAAVLRTAAAEGRLDLAELDDRLAQLYAARTYAELAPLTRDLPHTAPVDIAHGAGPDRAGGAPASGGAVAVMSGFERRGPWRVPAVFRCLAFWGGGKVDLREARFGAPDVTIRAFAVMGGIEILVPENAEVHVTGLGLMGGFNQAASGAGGPGGPRITVTGLAFWGGVQVERRPSDEESRRRKLERTRRELEGGTPGD